jgi:hypothetical protein
MAVVVGPNHHGASPGQEIGHMLVATEMLPVPVGQDHDVPGLRIGPGVHRDRRLVALEDLHLCFCAHGDAPSLSFGALIASPA